VKTRVPFLALATLLLSGVAASAQQRPLVTEDPETIGAGLILIEAGFDSQREIFFPGSGITGDLLRMPTLGVSFGVGSIAEIQVDGGIFNRLNVNERQPAPLAYRLDITGDSTSGLEDLTVGTKIRLVPEAPGRAAVGVRFATKLPFASSENGVGLGTTDFFASLLIGKTVQSIRIVGNGGIGILGDPVNGDKTGQVLTYGVSVARAVQQGLEVVGELDARWSMEDDENTPVGSENRGAVRFGGRFTKATVRIDGGVIIGLSSRDPSFGFTGGVTWVFRGFKVP
jgi:hypothetical protein